MSEENKEPKKKSRLKKTKVVKKKTTKRKRKKKKKYVPPKLPYKLIITKNKEKVAHIKSLPTEELAYQLFYKAIEENKQEVVFPVRFLNYKKILPVEYEIYIIKYKSEDDRKLPNTKLRNEYGEFIEYTTDHEDFIVVDKAKWELEETFWVYGYHPQQERKTFSWILENLIESTIHDKLQFKNVLIYKNKFIVDCGENNLKIVFCKNRDDAVRMYNEIEKICTQKKYKYILFSGDIQTKGRIIRHRWVQKLMDFTGFNHRKITRHCLRP